MLSVLLNTAATTANPQNAPINDQNAPRMFPTSCCCSLRYPRNLDTGVGSLCNGEAGMTRLRYRSMSRCQLSALLNTLISIKYNSKSQPKNEHKSKQPYVDSIWQRVVSLSRTALFTLQGSGHRAIFSPGATHPSFGPEPNPIPSFGSPKLRMTPKDAKTSNFESEY